MQEAVSERHVQALWYDAMLRPQNLRTTDGVMLHVVDPGCWNLEAGPDFRGAVLELGSSRRRVVGDVEVHLRPSDWLAHGHGLDPAYAQVILHVVWRHGVNVFPEGRRLPTGCVTVCLGDYLRTRPDFSPAEIDVTAYPYARLPKTPRPCQHHFAGDPDRLLSVLRSAGRRRLRLKAGGYLTRVLRGVPREQVFYEELLAALGYKYNGFPFRRLAQAIPWSALPSDPDAAAISYACAAAMKVTDETCWRRANVRPSNTPERRLVAAANLFAEGPQLMTRLLACELHTPRGMRAASAILTAGGGIGPHRAGAMLANVVVPFAMMEEKIRCIPEWICPEDLSAPVRLTAYRMLGRDHNVALYAGNGLLIQGLLQIYRDYCLAAHPDCTNCRIVRDP